MTFLDIFISTCDQDTYDINRSSGDSTNKTSTKCLENSECKLQFVSLGHYLVKYKLEKEGLYQLNILIDKKHIGQSPYILKCSTLLNQKTMKMSKSLFNIVENSTSQKKNISSNKKLYFETVFRVG